MSKLRIKETTATSGTGTMSLGGVVSGPFQTFVAGIGTGNACYYCIIDGSNWEVGLGTVTDATPDTLSRTTVLDSSAAGAKITLSGGTATVFCVADAEVNDWFDQSVKTTANVNFANLTLSANVILSNASATIRNAADTGRVILAGGSSAAASAGGFVQITGNDFATANAHGIVNFQAGTGGASPTGRDGHLIFTAGNGTRVILIDRGNNTVLENGNLGIGQTTFDATGTRTIAVRSGTAPTAGLSSCFENYAAAVGGVTCPHWMASNNDILKLYKVATLTQTHSTASNTHAAVTSSALATTAATNVAPWGFASQAQADNIATQVNNIRTDVENIKQFLNALADLDQSLGVAG